MCFIQPSAKKTEAGQMLSVIGVTSPDWLVGGNRGNNTSGRSTSSNMVSTRGLARRYADGQEEVSVPTFSIKQQLIIRLTTMRFQAPDDACGHQVHDRLRGICQRDWIRNVAL